MGYQIVAVTLRDGRRIEDVAVIQSSVIGEVRGHAEVPFEPGDITDIELTHRRWERQVRPNQSLERTDSAD
jgi:hypothetical protein